MLGRPRVRRALRPLHQQPAQPAARRERRRGRVVHALQVRPHEQEAVERPLRRRRTTSTNAVAPDPEGLGYFRSDAWMRRYAGNEEDGYRLSAAYRILQNTTGLELTATTNVAGRRPHGDRAAGRRLPRLPLRELVRARQGREGPEPPTGPERQHDVHAADRGRRRRSSTARRSPTTSSSSPRSSARRTSASTPAASRSSTSTAASRTRARRRCSSAASMPSRRSKTMQSAIAVVAKDPTFCQ